jgi:hypothetical protein
MTGPKRVTGKQLAANRRNAQKSTGLDLPEDLIWPRHFCETNPFWGPSSIVRCPPFVVGPCDALIVHRPSSVAWPSLSSDLDRHIFSAVSLVSASVVQCAGQ